MTKNNYLVLFFGLTLLFIGCKSENKVNSTNIEAKEIDALETRFKYLLDYPVGSGNFPRSMTLSPQKIRQVPSKDWTSGFFPGNLWQIYKITGNEAYKKRAEEWTALMEDQKYNAGTHDMGFKIYCSFGEGLKENPDNEHYKNVIVESAQTLITRFNKNIGSIRSWDFNKEVWQFPVIIDNMMNLELLFEATKISGDSIFHNLAVEHANTTLKNQFRDNHSIYHVIDYDTITGEVRKKDTHQGFNINSSWARGQAWGIYGYTLCYRYTKNQKYLEQAEATAKFYMENPNLPKDGIPYWDFNDPSIPEAPRDASAAAITTSALFELYRYTNNTTYLEFANKVLDRLNSKNYFLANDISAPFILDHSTGNWPKNDEIDEPIVYADYYFLEALLRKKALDQ